MMHIANCIVYDQKTPTPDKSGLPLPHARAHVCGQRSISSVTFGTSVVKRSENWWRAVQLSLVVLDMAPRSRKRGAREYKFKSLDCHSLCDIYLAGYASMHRCACRASWRGLEASNRFPSGRKTSFQVKPHAS
jgi:hypothetical protein